MKFIQIENSYFFIKYDNSFEFFPVTIGKGLRIAMHKAYKKIISELR